MTPWLRKLHKWVGLIIAVQFVLWMASGLMMAWLEHDKVQGHEFRARAAEPRAWPTDARPASTALAAVGGDAFTVASGWLLERPVYQVFDGARTHLVDARTGTRLAIDAALAGQLARASYTGPGQAAPARLLERTLEVRDHPGRLWRVDFDDAEETTVYLAADTGQVLQHRNRTWRLFDVFWMLHIMDYSGRVDFNNPLVVSAGIGGLWMALTGVWLLFASFRLSEFVPRRWRGGHELAVHDPDGTCLRTVTAADGDNVYLALARNGLQLPSNCGGGQSCGLCEVRFRGTPPPATAADRAHLPESRLKLGYRLACNLHVDKDTHVEVSGGSRLWTEHEAVVERVEAVTPFLREIVLKTDTALGEEYQPGAYLQVHVPDYRLRPHDLAHPEHHRDDWRALELPADLVNKEAVRRSYSLSLPVANTEGRLSLLARFNPGAQGKKRVPTGKGSTYLYSLKAGDKVRFSGPFGDFAIKPGHREKVFIGGGAGMAPLRAMIHACLDGGAGERMHFWYGARSLRDAPYIEEMAALAQRHANFSWHLVLSDEAECGDGLLRGLVHEVAEHTLLRDHPDLHACDFYLCGPPAMLMATRQLLKRLGVDEARIAYDDFKI
ncbi:2Fe-2S iron-sulfur cluster-binding protein [Pseudoxanthomonas beigongshangi]|uniref:2Fe-2S iron-sulfur cluster-binding protein n=1 Tax=Pseudoxanthomonas beigongshangi TaxID=2782537 RepID=UPI00193BCA64|nr:2Fe-2S iron-sulfur cluster-binding protein [Pseudoxanthomonas beigongshangi]